MWAMTTNSMGRVLAIRGYVAREGLGPDAISESLAPPGDGAAVAGLRKLVAATASMDRAEAAAFIEGEFARHAASGEFPPERSPGRDNGPENEPRGPDLGR